MLLGVEILVVINHPKRLPMTYCLGHFSKRVSGAAAKSRTKRCVDNLSSYRNLTSLAVEMSYSSQYLRELLYYQGVLHHLCRY